jgi:hypothetical protein
MAKRKTKPTLDPARAARAVNFIERLCTHVKGDLANKPFLLEQWQRTYIEQLFGTIGRDGLRQYRTSFVFLPRKNGKSNLIAAIGLYLLFGDNEPGAEIYVAAADREQANAIFEVQKQMVQNNALLRGKCKIYRRTIYLNCFIRNWSGGKIDVAICRTNNRRSYVEFSATTQADVPGGSQTSRRCDCCTTRNSYRSSRSCERTRSLISGLRSDFNVCSSNGGIQSNRGSTRGN